MGSRKIARILTGVLTCFPIKPKYRLSFLKGRNATHLFRGDIDLHFVFCIYKFVKVYESNIIKKKLSCVFLTKNLNSVKVAIDIVCNLSFLCLFCGNS